MAVTPATIVIPDISGYTSFISQMEIEHGAYIIGQLIENIITQADMFIVSEVEGDAVLLYAKGLILSKKTLLKQCLKMFHEFHVRRKTLYHATKCNCNACKGIDKLTLKFIVHYGDIYELQISNFLKPSGIEVVLAHRLLKNTIDSHEYILMTQGFLAQTTDGKESYDLVWVEHSQEIDNIGNVAYQFTLLNSKQAENA